MAKAWRVAWATLAAVLLATGGALCADGPKCVIGGQSYPAGVRIGFGPDAVKETGSSQACYLAHGMRFLGTCFAGLSDEEICAFVHAQTPFKLYINGAMVQPTYIDIRLNSDADPFPGFWVVMYVYEFPTGFSVPGVYVVEAFWHFAMSGKWCDACTSAEECDDCIARDPEVKCSFDRTLGFDLTVTVLP